MFWRCLASYALAILLQGYCAAHPDPYYFYRKKQRAASFRRKNKFMDKLPRFLCVARFFLLLLQSSSNKGLQALCYRKKYSGRHEASSGRKIGQHSDGVYL